MLVKFSGGGHPVPALSFCSCLRVGDSKKRLQNSILRLFVAAARGSTRKVLA